MLRPRGPPASLWSAGACARFLTACPDAAAHHTADRRTLLRRVTIDLAGLPPTPEEMVAFLADRSPCVYQKVVERFLASPRYGERWASQWLDPARHAETGGEHNHPRPNAWPCAGAGASGGPTGG